MILAGNDHAAAGRTMDDQQITVCIPAAYNTHMAVIGVKYQVTGLGLVPGDRRTICVLRLCAAAMAHHIRTVADIVECPVYEARTVQAVSYAPCGMAVQGFRLYPWPIRGTLAKKGRGAYEYGRDLTDLAALD